MVQFFHEFALTFYRLHHLIIFHGFGQFEVDVLILLHEIDDMLYSFLYGLTHSLAVIKYRFLFQITDLIISVKPYFAIIILVTS